MKYSNPVICGFHPDPSICRVGKDYYLATSSFEYFPGVPLFHSRDLVHWRPIGHCLTRESQLPLGTCPSGVSGIFAPTLRHHAGRFYMVTTNVFTKWNFFVHAQDPAGPWSEPVFIDQAGYDPSLLFDDDGRAYYSRWGDGNVIVTGELDIATGQLLTPVREVWPGGGGLYPEGPHLYKIDGRYYLMAAEGGTHIGHVETIARSPSPYGPFENCPHNPILTHRKDNLLAIQATGHADLIQAHDGSWWAVFLGIRPRSRQFFPYHHLGRETFLAPVNWSDGWPVVNGGRIVDLEMDAGNLAPHPWPPEPARDGFDSPALRPCWNYLRNPQMTNYSLTARPGFLRLTGSKTSLDDAASPTFVGRRQEHFSCRVAALLDFTPRCHAPTRIRLPEGCHASTRTAPEACSAEQQAGLTVLANEMHHYDLFVTSREERRFVILRQRIGELCVETARCEIGPGPVLLEIVADSDHYRFFAAVQPSAGGPGAVPLRAPVERDAAQTVEQGHAAGQAIMQPLELGTAQTRYLSTEVVGGFTGVYLGMFVSGTGDAPADFDWFEYEFLVLCYL